MNRNRWRAVCFSLSLLLLIAAVAQIMFPELNNWKLQVKGKSSVYLRCEDLEADKLADELYNTEGYFGGSTTLVLKKKRGFIPQKGRLLLRLPIGSGAGVYPARGGDL